MTYIQKTLDKICENYCPIYEACEREYECEERKTIKTQIVEIMRYD